MKLIRYGIPLLLLIISIIYFVQSLHLEHATAGNPYEPIYFPLFSSGGLFIFSLAYLVQERRKEIEETEDLKQFVKRETIVTVAVVVFLSLLYTFLFEVIGFLLSTVLFLGAILFYLNGAKKWILNVSLSLLSSFTFWYLFDVVLNVNLP